MRRFRYIQHAVQGGFWFFASLLSALRCLTNRRVYGQGLVEYALILVLVAIVVIGSLTLVGQRTSTVFAQISCTFEGGTFHIDNGNGKSAKCK